MEEIIINLLSPGLLFGLFAVAVLFNVIVGVALSYHWREYSMDSHRSKQVYKTYVFVSVVLLGAMLVGILLYTSGT